MVLNAAIPQKKLPNTAISQKITPNTAILQYRVETRCHTETATLYIKFRANNTETEIWNARFRQNKEHPVACWLIINKK